MLATQDRPQSLCTQSLAGQSDKLLKRLSGELTSAVQARWSRRRDCDSSLRCRQNEIAVKSLFRCGQSFFPFNGSQKYGRSYKGAAVPSRGDWPYIEVRLLLHLCRKPTDRKPCTGTLARMRAFQHSFEVLDRRLWAQYLQGRPFQQEQPQLWANLRTGLSTSSPMATASRSMPIFSTTGMRVPASISSRLQQQESLRQPPRTLSGLSRLGYSCKTR